MHTLTLLVRVSFEARVHSHLACEALRSTPEQTSCNDEMTTYIVKQHEAELR